MTEFPPALFSLANLKFVDLSGTAIAELPEEVLDWKNLEILSFEDNQRMQDGFLDAATGKVIKALQQRGVSVQVTIANNE